MRVSVIGLGKLGAPLAALIADRGHEVMAVDTRPDAVALVNQGRTPVAEPEVQELIARNRSRLQATTDAPTAVAATELTLIIVPTPSTASGTFSLDFVREVIAAVGAGLRRKSAYHVVTITSTVAPLSLEQEIRPLLERTSGRVVGDSVGLCYNPEFVALGTVVNDMRNPDFVLIGESDSRAGDVLTSLQRSLVGATVPIRRMNLTNAELAKLAVNTYVTTKISYANMLGEMCERLPGADVAVITEAIGTDRRIGQRYFKGALGYGGPCFPRDNVALAAVASSLGVSADLPTATDAVNRRQLQRLVRLVQSHLDDGSRVGVLGLSYKPGTPVVENSQALELANALARDGVTVSAFDPAVGPASAEIDRRVHLAPSLGACVDEADVVVVAVPWPEFGQLPALLAERTRPATVIDCWRVVDTNAMNPRVTVVHVGRHAETDARTRLPAGANADGR